MPKKSTAKKAPKIYSTEPPLKTAEMRVEDNGKSIVVSGRRFKRVVLSSCLSRPNSDDEIQDLDELEAGGPHTVDD